MLLLKLCVCIVMPVALIKYWLIVLSTCPMLMSFFQLLQLLYVFLSASKAHEIYISTQLKLHPHKQVRQIQVVSETRWACRFAAVDVVCSTFDSIIATLKAIVNGTDKAKGVEAKILFQIHAVRFIRGVRNKPKFCTRFLDFSDFY